MISATILMNQSLILSVRPEVRGTRTDGRTDKGAGSANGNKLSLSALHSRFIDVFLLAIDK